MLGDKWMYRFPWQSTWYGLDDDRRESVLRSADLLINVSGTLQRPEEYRHIPRMAYIDSDPVFTQVKIARGQHDFRRMIDTHDVQFSFPTTHSFSIAPVSRPTPLHYQGACQSPRHTPEASGDPL